MFSKPEGSSAFPETFLLLQNEGYLMQGCLQSAFISFRTASSSSRGQFYAALFNFSIGYERLLKLCLILGHVIQTRSSFPGNKFLKDLGHDLLILRPAAEALFSQHSIVLPKVPLDDIDSEILALLSSFARTSRYYNLDSLTQARTYGDPLLVLNSILTKIYHRDFGSIKRIHNEDQISGSVEMMEDFTTTVGCIGLDGKSQTHEEFCQDHGRMELILPELIWRLNKQLVPFKELLFSFQEFYPSSVGIPCMYEFLNFVATSKEMIASNPDWPY